MEKIGLISTNLAEKIANSVYLMKAAYNLGLFVIKKQKNNDKRKR